jgi:hypothetical protein
MKLGLSLGVGRSRRDSNYLTLKRIAFPSLSGKESMLFWPLL